MISGRIHLSLPFCRVRKDRSCFAGRSSALHCQNSRCVGLPALSDTCIRICSPAIVSPLSTDASTLNSLRAPARFSTHADHRLVLHEDHLTLDLHIRRECITGNEYVYWE